MTDAVITRPAEDEYLSYYGRYISLVPEGDIVTILATQIDDTLSVLRSLPESKGSFKYAPDKWTVKELVGHLTDAERIFANRALRFGRHDQTSLPGFEENNYVRNSSFNDYPLAELADGFEAVRRSSVFLFKHMTKEASLCRGKANNAEISARALAYVMAGHERHHIEVLKTRYLA